MPKSAVLRVPQPSRHKASGQSVVRLNGRDFYLGPHGSAQAKAAYERLMIRWLNNGRQLPVEEDEEELSVEEVLARYWLFAEQHYRKDGQPTKELDNVRYAVRPLEDLYADTTDLRNGSQSVSGVITTSKSENFTTTSDSSVTHILNETSDQ